MELKSATAAGRLAVFAPPVLWRSARCRLPAFPLLPPDSLARCSSGVGPPESLQSPYSGSPGELQPWQGSNGSFRIDHPLDPASKYLSHSFVESPDMKNVYDGTVDADENGNATVTMPEWFEDSTRTSATSSPPSAGLAPDLHVKAKLADGTFTIGGAKAGQEICWQVTGTRKDAWANAHRIEVETDKPKKERGTYLFPKGFGQPETKRVGYQEPPTRK